MKAELEQKSIDLLKWLEQTIKTTADFGAEQIPLFIQELLVYHYWASLSCFIIGFVLLILTLGSLYTFTKWLRKPDTHNMDAMPALLIWILPLIGCVSMMVNNTEWFMIQLAPRLYLLEYVKDMIKQ